ncbi:hypothetical protein Syun_028786 [Stephania yunnanensis]|uniref:very-long-chain 3-oxoacyl-CoA synthase n=1 Tax=Stephania yunnanensis TaxID=152371 RepID=A0AAP0E7R4_9MAGN
MAEDFLVKNKISPKSIDILVVNCSIFCPTPSISSMFVKRIGLRSNIRSYNLTGMGCSAGLLSVSLAKDLLKIHKNSLALVVSLESLTHNGYPGKVKSMLLTNTLFRSGGTIILLSNRKQDRRRAKYVLQHLVRINMGFDDQSYTCVFQENDEEGHVGVSLSRRTMHIASNALRTNMVRLGPLVLPYSEKIRYLWSLFLQRVCADPKSKQYIPDFKKAFEHFCIHSGGRAVIDAVEDNLSLSEEDVEPSRMALYRFGNTSSSSVWYALCYLEAKGRVKRGDRVWQIAFGSGFKCNSAVWKCVSDVDPTCSLNPWSDRIHLYPVEVPEILDT